MVHYSLPGVRFASEYPFASFYDFERRTGNPPLQMCRALSGENGGCSCQVEIQKPHLTSCEAACVHEGAGCPEDICFAPAAELACPLCTLTVRHEPYPSGRYPYQQQGRQLRVAALADGWLYAPADTQEYVLHVSGDYKKLTAYLAASEPEPERLFPLVCTALECASIRQGVLSLHSACVELDGKAVCLTADSGVGKSTRAMSWKTGLGARILSGDRPSLCIRTEGVTAGGAPWDGKEQLYVNAGAPLLAVCSIRRGCSTYARKLSLQQARRVLYQQCFLPMWDSDTTAAAMQYIEKLCRMVPVYRVVCGPDESAAEEVRELLFDHQERIRETEKEMKIKNGFTLRNLSGDFIVMPTGKNIREFDGAIVLNETAAFIWEQLRGGCSREELLEAVLSEFETDREKAEADLDALLEKLRGYQVIEEESV